MQIDKIKHFGACCYTAMIVGAVLIVFNCPWQGCVSGSFLSAIAIGIGKEYGDSKAVGNKWDWYDIVADVCGGIAGSLVIATIAML